jgi:arsenate reductase
LIKGWKIHPSIELQDIKQSLYSAQELDEMKCLAGKYEALFSKRSQKYKPLKVAEKVKTDNDYRHFLLSDYSFLKRPVLVYDSIIFIGNSAETEQKISVFLSDLETR